MCFFSWWKRNSWYFKDFIVLFYKKLVKHTAYNAHTFNACLKMWIFLITIILEVLVLFVFCVEIMLFQFEDRSFDTVHLNIYK